MVFLIRIECFKEIDHSFGLLEQIESANYLLLHQKMFSFSQNLIQLVSQILNRNHLSSHRIELIFIKFTHYGNLGTVCAIQEGQLTGHFFYTLDNIHVVQILIYDFILLIVFFNLVLLNAKKLIFWLAGTHSVLAAGIFLWSFFGLGMIIGMFSPSSNFLFLGGVVLWGDVWSPGFWNLLLSGIIGALF